MARCEMKLPDEFMDKLSKLGDKFGSVAPVLEAGGSSALSDEDNLRNVIGKNPKVNPARQGLWRKVSASPALQDGRAMEYQSRRGSSGDKGAPGCLKAQVLEYGKAGQPADPG